MSDEQATPRRRLVELSHIIHDGMVTYPGLPGPELFDHLTFDESRNHYAPGTEFRIRGIKIVANTGTYLDTPAHRYADGTDLAGIPLESLADLDGIVVRVLEGPRGLDHTVLAPHDVAGKAVLIHTGWDSAWQTPKYGAGGHPYVTADAARWLVEHGAALVGIDSVNIDDTDGGERPAHTTLLAAGIPIVEHLTGLGALPTSGFRFTATPPRIDGLGTFPVRAFAVVV